jgi:hypothetical protein
MRAWFRGKGEGRMLREREGEKVDLRCGMSKRWLWEDRCMHTMGYRIDSRYTQESKKEVGPGFVGISSVCFAYSKRCSELLEDLNPIKSLHN